ncbi:hypothetical protein SFRURICE_007359 [Spodoptera frugiperda]|nr:hypothetical protein SFRURICE_007359 [Spodoptera frugiperda]
MTSQISCIAHMKFACELTQIENPNEQQLGRKPARLITSPGRRILLFLGNFTLCSLKSTCKSTDDVLNPNSIYEVYIINMDRKSQRTTVGQKARQVRSPRLVEEFYFS